MILLVMIVMWMASLVNFMLINLYLKYVPGGVYLNFSIAGVAEILANLAAGILFAKFGPRLTFIVGYIISLAGGILLIF